MNTFDGITFRGTFRDYQQKVLDSVEGHSNDGKIHIVAAPGSGKTVLGLELIRFLGEPALVLSPSIVICQQWGERFEEMFLSKGAALQDYVSNNLKQPELITSVTYQALHAAYNRLAEAQAVFESDDETEREGQSKRLGTAILDEARDETEGEARAETKGMAQREAEDEVQTYDFTDFDLLAFVRNSGIKTICLDEAHHLKQEWQKALEGFISQIEHEVRIIALTATPPYDSSPGEWNRYISVCGEIDEEIFIPELVAQRTLCPHQDYIYFNYPTDEESRLINQHQKSAADCLEQIVQSGLLLQVLDEAGVSADKSSGFGTIVSEEQLYGHAQAYLALFAFAKTVDIEIPKRPFKALTLGRLLPKFSIEEATKVLSFVLDNPGIFSEETRQRLMDVARAHKLLSKGKILLDSSPKTIRALVASLGKLKSIATIAEAEYQALNHRLRMLVLTDFIRKDCLDLVGTDKEIGALGTVPIFEQIRRVLPEYGRVGLISGTLVIWPEDRVDELQEIASSCNTCFSAKKLAGTGYCVLTFKGGNRVKVRVVTQAFQRGHVQVVVGTKSLLGEGWDSPCINSLIMASFVGSYVLSNQMRGRAIRVVHDDPDKTANIWHLVSVEPKYELGDSLLTKLDKAMINDDTVLRSFDYRTLSRRFECFFAPAYSSNAITNGIERIDIVKPPYNQAGYARINREMLERASNRLALADSWNDSLGSEYPTIVDIAQVPRDETPRIRNFVLLNLLYAAIVLSIYSFIVLTLDLSLYGAVELAQSDPFVLLFVLALTVMVGAFGTRIVTKILKVLSPIAVIKGFALSIRETLEEVGEIKTQGTTVKVIAEDEGLFVECALHHATVHEKNVFSKALAEMLSPLDNPRYLVISNSRIGFKYSQSYACPSVFSNAKTVERFAKALASHRCGMNVVYTRNPKGHKLLQRCRKKSYINRNAKYVKRFLRAE